MPRERQEKRMITYYSLSNRGAIESSVERPIGKEDLRNPDLEWIVGAHDPGEFYVDPETKQPVPLNEFDIQFVDNVITGLPGDAIVWVRGNVRRPINGNVIIPVEYECDLSIKITAPTYRRLKQTFHIVPGAPGTKIKQSMPNLRRDAYGDTGDQMDDVMRFMQAMIGYFDEIGESARVPEAVRARVSKWADVKVRIPKKGK